MALTAVAPTRNTLSSVTGMSTGSLQVPRKLATVAIDTNDNKGFAITQPKEQGPAAIVTLTGDQDWYWADTDSLAVTAMNLVKAGYPQPFQCTPELTQNFYMKTAVSANVTCAIVA